MSRRRLIGSLGATLFVLGTVAPAGAHGPGPRPQDQCYDRNARTSWECPSWERRLREDEARRRDQEERRRQAEQDRQQRQRDRMRR